MPPELEVTVSVPPVMSYRPATADGSGTAVSVPLPEIFPAVLAKFQSKVVGAAKDEVANAKMARPIPNLRDKRI